ncbi:uncharacterized protein LOC122280706 [Carya illinoinensis]|uniref:Protein kinase domain-containing protein n=1 Tax=Carya illinoinensis TaxID=32201 RepID=A0A8T1NU69_CARIL|nr:uncharacterized protein LOC122280706 [Carya illinoinensis]KAG6635705.1 hypothetical protein CIPAW_11G061500 [Carya illinoinensis]KAG6635706.1 hypothetical protein CIPAW_11G061500 [Carya illinoinensis]
MDPRNEESQPASESFMQDPLNGMHANMRPPDLHVSKFKPVNYSIQTGEEFALEFMLDRVNPRKPLLPNNDPNYATGYTEIKGILGISHTGSESGSDISMLTTVEKGPKEKEFVRNNSSLHEDRSNYGSLQSVPRTYDSSRGVVQCYTSSGASNNSLIKMKVLCSFGGKILPRPGDGKLRYVGGETRIISIRKEISWQELMQKTLSIYNQVHVIKYQLPGEDLDALVSVSCDEDLQNMMEECNELEDGEGSQKLRMFLFSMSDLDDVQLGLVNVDGDSEVQYVVAVNGMDIGSRRNSTLHGLVSSSANILDVFDGHDVERESRPIVDSIGVITLPLTGTIVSSSTVQSSQAILPSSSDVYEPHQQFDQGQMTYYGESQQYPLHHDQASHHSPFGGITTSVPPHGLMNQQGGLTEGQPFTGLQVQNLEISGKQLRPKCDGSIQQKSATKKVFSSEKDYNVNLIDNLPVEEAGVLVTAPEGDTPLLASRTEVQHKEAEKTSSSVDAENPVQVPKSSYDDHYSMSGIAIAPGYAESESSAIDLSYLETHVHPQRFYYSERIPRGQAELLNRLSKSDDSRGSQFLIPHSRSDIAEQDSITECIDKLHDSDQPPQTEQFTSTAKPLFTDTRTIDDGLAPLQKYKEFTDAIFQMNSKLSQDEDCDLNHEFVNHVNNEDAVNENTVLKSDHATNCSKDQDEKPLAEEPGEAGSELPALSQVAPFKHPKNITSDQLDDTKGHAQPIYWMGSTNEDVSQDIPSSGESKPVQGDILIDIEDRFSRNFLSDMFSRAVLSEDSSGVSPLHKDGAGLSINLENHEPKHWSYFQKLAQEGLVQKDVSLIDQDHFGFSPAIRKVEEGDHVSHPLKPLTTDGVPHSHVDSQLNFDEDDQKEPGMLGDSEVLHSNYGHSQVKGTESMQFDRMMENLRMPESEYEEVKLESRNIGLPPLNPSLGDVDISTLQIIMNEDLEELKELGSGTFGTVYHGKWRGTDVAIKRIKKSCFMGRSSEQERLTLEFWREADILSKLHHPNVVAFYGVVQDGPGGTLATVTEYMVDGSLRHVLVRKDRYLDRRKRLIIAMDAAFGMEYLHSKNIVHFDLKCDNLLVNLKDPSRPICKVGDFGLSKIKKNTLVSGGVRGTLPWMAPELLNGSSNKVSEKVDVFSFGIVLWEILTGEEPYANMHYGEIIGGIVNNTLRPIIPSYCDPEWRRLMEQCWAPNPAIRPSFTEIASCLRVMSAAASQTKAHGHKPSK